MFQLCKHTNTKPHSSLESEGCLINSQVVKLTITNWMETVKCLHLLNIPLQSDKHHHSQP